MPRSLLTTPTVVSDVTEDLGVTEFTQSDLYPIAVGSEVLEGMEALSKKSVSFPKLSPILTTGTAAFLDALAKGTTDERSRCIPTAIFSGHVVLNASPSILVPSPRSFVLTFIPVRESISNSRGSTGGRSYTRREQMTNGGRRVRTF